MRTYFLICSILLTGIQQVFAQPDASLSVELSQSSVTLGETFEVKVTLENASNGTFIAPDWEAAGFFVLNTSQSSSFSFSNGVSISQATYTYRLMPRDTGLIALPEVMVKLRDKELKSVPETVQVLPGNPHARPDNRIKISPVEPATEPKKKIKTIRI